MADSTPSTLWLAILPDWFPWQTAEPDRDAPVGGSTALSMISRNEVSQPASTSRATLAEARRGTLAPAARECTKLQGHIARTRSTLLSRSAPLPNHSAVEIYIGGVHRIDTDAAAMTCQVIVSSFTTEATTSTRIK